jgi:hypothetical protein
MANDTPEKQLGKDLPKMEMDSRGQIRTPLELRSDIESEEEEESVPAEVAEVLKELPPERRREVTSLFLSMQRMSSPTSSALMKRIASEHITKTLDNFEKENERDFKKSQASELTKRLGMGAILLLVLIVLVYAGLTQDKELAEKVIIAGISGVGGFGVGVAASKSNQ